MEKIIVARLYGYVEHHNLLDKEQDGFRRFRGNSQALLCTNKDIMNGFSRRESTLTVMVDIEKAYDSVWRDGILYMLDRKGIKGRLWFWLNSFLQERTASCKLRNQEGERFVSHVGLPPGSVLSPLLFNLFIKDIFETVTSNKVQFADNGTLWRNGKDISEVIQALEVDLVEIRQWVKKWRMKLNILKTEYMYMYGSFSKDQRILDFDIEIRIAIILLKRTRKLNCWE